MGIDSIKQKGAPKVPKTVDARPVELAPLPSAKKPDEGFDVLKKKLMSVSGRYAAPKVEDSGRSDLKDLIAKQRTAVQAGTVAPAKSSKADTSAASAMKQLAAANTRPGSVSGQEMTDAIRTGIKDRDNNGAAGEYQVISKWVKDNDKLLSPDAKASFAAYEKLVKAAQAEGKPGLVVNSFQGPGGTSTAPGAVAEVLKEAAKDPAVKGEIADVQKAISEGKFEKAGAAMKKAVGNTDDLFDEQERKTVQSQLQFLGQMQKAGIKDVSYPPKEAQLLEYFSTLKKDPSQARDAFRDYVKSFHVHPVDVKGAAQDVVYSADQMVSKKVKGMKDIQDITTHIPETWSEVLESPPKDEKGDRVTLGRQSVGKQVNDCEGFGFMAQKLLGAAGFKVDTHVTVHGGAMKDADHAMVIFTHPPEEKDFTVVSNDSVNTHKTRKGAAVEGYEYAAPRKEDADGDKVPDVRGTEVFFRGPTMHDSQVAAKSKGPRLG